MESAVFQVVVAGVPGWWAGPGFLQFPCVASSHSLSSSRLLGVGELEEGGGVSQRGDIRGLVLYFVCWYYFFDSG